MRFEEYRDTSTKVNANGAAIETLANYMLREGATKPSKGMTAQALVKLLTAPPYSYSRTSAYRLLQRTPGFAQDVNETDGALTYYFEADIARKFAEPPLVYPSAIVTASAYAVFLKERKIEPHGTGPSTLREAFKLLYDLLPPAAKGEKAVNAAHAVIAEHGITPDARQALLVIVADMFNQPAD